jgi:hypothetical protein
MPQLSKMEGATENEMEGATENDGNFALAAAQSVWPIPRRQLHPAVSG